LQLIIENGKNYGFPEDYLNYLEGFVALGWILGKTIKTNGV
jgi:hypothetical protein